MTVTRKASGGVAFRVARRPPPAPPRAHPILLLPIALGAWGVALLAIHIVARLLP